ncbi:MAG: dTDP-glucose 4,6-dehydratase [Proteobacteria bacterium]|nr:dTDP-glucose 4,6-dehydratase [Pseudomonadota bacterium]
MNTTMITGGCGFIGANFLNLFVPRKPEQIFVNIDKLTYAANPMSLADIEDKDNYIFEHADICDQAVISDLFAKYNPDTVIHFAAESHVDRSIHGPRDFLLTNVLGTLNLLEASRAQWKAGEDRIFHHVSTDEVYGSLGDEGFFNESSAYDPSSPYSASKAGSDHLVRAYHRTYGLPITVTNCSNNYGPYQFPEKLIPLMILNAAEGKPLPVYGEGKNVRDWLYVTDHCEAIMRVIEHGKLGETYNIGGNCEMSNIDVVTAICDVVAEKTDKRDTEIRQLITYVEDRPGHDFRYAIDATKIRDKLGWVPSESFDSGLHKTVDWYLGNEGWISAVRTGEYRNWLEKNYKQRGRNG